MSGDEVGDVKKRPFGFTGRVRSFRYAFEGIGLMLRTQHNAWIHAAATLVVIGAGLALQVSAGEWLWLTVAVVMVWVAEALNTAFEFLADATVAEFHPLVKNAKDVAAGAVLISAIGAVVIGLIVLLPRVWLLISAIGAVVIGLIVLLPRVWLLIGAAA